MARALKLEQEKALRMKLGFLCMAAVAGEEGDMKLCTESILDYVSEMIEPEAVITNEPR